ncbi:hypothetical protein NE237_019981 [Protea cynaroides]|uniref:Uncharacterized protein n=1 Tax=Protea cynaroides TaxID=273540 RepID=A0A9Q0H7I6_9MAGN|nr:hypothetical protein NE237_019981 [Protea cynaroides]
MLFANSALHWFANCEFRPNTTPSFIVSFDLHDEEYGELPLPGFDFVKNNENHMKLGVLGGQICVLAMFHLILCSLIHTDLIIQQFFLLYPPQKLHFLHFFFHVLEFHALIKQAEASKASKCHHKDKKKSLNVVNSSFFTLATSKIRCFRKKEAAEAYSFKHTLKVNPWTSEQ